MTMRMLIDARHREETRVAVVKGNRIEEFDFESAEHKQLKGNIYLAKVTRVEPSLQAAFVDYGGNRHGFLAFSEIHPDYYQIPKEDREALLREEAEHAAEEEALRARADEDDDDEDYGDDREGGDDDGVEEMADIDHDDDEDHDHEEGASEDGEQRSEGGRGRGRRGKAQADDGAVEALRTKRMNLRRRYKIQDVIRRRQVLLVQVVKEERGNKGAALTTYLSLAGRYCVLMPNTSHGGGISRKISNAGDRKRLKSIMADMQLPSSMGCIVRTAGLSRTKVEIKRDFDYLARLWDEIREKTLASAAPALVYGDSDLMKRAIRDIYNRDIEDVIIEGEEGYRAAKDFMKLLMPSHARKVKPYADAIPLFQRFGVEDQLAAMYNPTVQLKSGGYLVINPTEALVSIDINSGRSTREHGIEQTAVATNLEAAHEIARQLRLRDMAGLVVIDFIDMENNSNVRKVEKAMKGALANDRARIQVGRISSFGLMEMSRQRLRTGVLEASTRQCPHCEGTGLVRTASSAGLSALRMLEDEAGRGRGSRLTLRASQEAAVYVLNRKRAELAEIEDRYGVLIDVLPDGEDEGARMSVEASGPPPEHAPRFELPVFEEDDDDLPLEDEYEEEEAAEEEAREAREDRGERGVREGGAKRRRRRRGRRSGRREEGEPREEGDEPRGDEDSDPAESVEGEAAEAQDAGDHDADGEEGRERKRRSRRGRRGGRRRREGGEAGAEGSEELNAEGEAIEAEAPAETEKAPEPVAETEEKPKRARRRPKAEAKIDPPAAAPAPEAEVETAPVEAPKRRGRAKAAPVAEVAVVEAPAAEEAVAEEAAAEKPKRTRRKAAPKADVAAEPEVAVGTPVAEEAPAEKPKRTRKKAVTQAEAAPAVEAKTAEATAEGDDADGSPRRGWWQRTFGAQE